MGEIIDILKFSISWINESKKTNIFLGIIIVALIIDILKFFIDSVFSIGNTIPTLINSLFTTGLEIIYVLVFVYLSILVFKIAFKRCDYKFRKMNLLSYGKFILLLFYKFLYITFLRFNLKNILIFIIPSIALLMAGLITSAANQMFLGLFLTLGGLLFFIAWLIKTIIISFRISLSEIIFLQKEISIIDSVEDSHNLVLGKTLKLGIMQILTSIPLIIVAGIGALLLVFFADIIFLPFGQTIASFAGNIVVNIILLAPLFFTGRYLELGVYKWFVKDTKVIGKQKFASESKDTKEKISKPKRVPKKVTQIKKEKKVKTKISKKKTITKVKKKTISKRKSSKEKKANHQKRKA